jgi:hypothetical protein
VARGSFASALAVIGWRVAGGVLLALTQGGCPGGAELEDPDRFEQYPPMGGASGAPGVSGAGGATAGAGGSVSGSSGSAGGTGVSCDIVAAMPQNCGRNCHDATTRAADLDFSNLDTIAAQLVDKPALHAGVGCNAVGMPFRQCTPEELTAKGCPSNVMLIDSASFESSWLVKKLTPGEEGDCGAAMPYPPGNSTTRGWSEARRTCYLEYFRSLIPAEVGR